MNGYCCQNGHQSFGLNFSMEATGYKVFNDSVHGHITLHPLLVKVVDTPQFQRLRNIKQLGFANYVFPGANNCRYEHSLGTCYLAGKMVEKLLSRESGPRSNEDKFKMTLCVQLAALCHDLGHGPFSHTWERITETWGYDWKHESASIQMFDYLVKENNLHEEFRKYNLGEEEIKIIKELIIGGPDENKKPLLANKDNFFYEIVSNKNTGIDVDRWDYFLRDGLHLNLRITFDYRRLLEFSTILYDDDGLTHINFRDKEMLNLYDMYRVRSALHYAAYRHKVVINIEQMCIDAFKAAGDAGYKINNSETLLKEAHLAPESFSTLTDHVFYDILYSRDERLSAAQQLLQRVLKRDLYKFVGSINFPIAKRLSKKEQKECIEKEKFKVLSKLENDCKGSKFSVEDFYLYLDSTSDPVANVKFYKKTGEETIEKETFENIKNRLAPFPFQLSEDRTAQLLVFCKNQDVKKNQLEKAENFVKQYKTQCIV
ncbi:deoxynucleoside triphosphate triphosphohydrolase SAMHD1 isoform X1 [Homalodisca vitripennis]|uniref:deoxynucleoside triphosphate triphosphohydrolase SAMHD1 isoform X1 n=1 Tax=Homalodisca vitripennis TaxID=197043 RepID=UPI001EE9B053|nr:deoxynucleoside triphosphate triphosphohydrolase SAMHD1 isoform X1 [Homalodisca vitripennis]